MTFTIDTRDSDVFTVLRAFIMDALGTAVNDVIKVPANRASMPKLVPFITMAPLLKQEVHKPVVTTSAPPGTQSSFTKTAIEFHIQLDAYGPTAGDLTSLLFGLLDSPEAFNFFASNTALAIRPLYAEAPHQAPLVDDEMQYDIRWSMRVCLQYNPILTTTPVQTASTVTVGTVNVEATYGP